MKIDQVQVGMMVFAHPDIRRDLVFGKDYGGMTVVLKRRGALLVGLHRDEGHGHSNVDKDRIPPEFHHFHDNGRLWWVEPQELIPATNVD